MRSCMASPTSVANQFIDVDGEDEEDDIDFNPFIRPPSSPEASSSLSSEPEPTFDQHLQENEATNLKFINKYNNRNDEIPQTGTGDSSQEDPISRRTRARYSLKNFTLDQLETFLQESDNEDDLSNVDDQAYQKFLATVLRGMEETDGAGKCSSDEDNDADFDIEEALETDQDETEHEPANGELFGINGNFQGQRLTRQNRPQKKSAARQSKVFELSKLHLRPILPFPSDFPYPPSTVAATFNSQSTPVCCFTAHQLNQLYCLIHEHVQLLVQIFSLSVLENSKQHIAGQVQGLIFELLRIRSEAVKWRKVPYPTACFQSSYLYSSVSNSTAAAAKPATCSNQAGQGSMWVTVVNEPVMSILDVPTLGLVGDYVRDAAKAAQEYKQRHLLRIEESRKFEKVPLFPLPKSNGANSVIRDGNTTISSDQGIGTGLLSQQPKKTLAGVLVESSKKQSVALVPGNLEMLAQRFLPFFNSELFPHKPPSSPGPSRVLFTDAEDELLALGLLVCNNDWKAIQQRFLPCKTKHQIFVRAKNRVSSKAPENPIKAVRRMKTSPLSQEEIALVQEGLRVFKLDWMLVWKFFLPYRDPSLLPRQWRVASGTHKSYKMNEISKAKRRLYESRRRRNMTLSSLHKSHVNVGMPNGDSARGGNSSDQDGSADGLAISGDDANNSEEVYVPEVLLADYAQETIAPVPVGQHYAGKDLSSSNAYQESFPSNCSTFRCFSSHISPPTSQQLRTDVNAKCSVPCPRPSHVLSSSVASRAGYPYRHQKSGVPHMVQLSPDLPPVNLPPSVCVISQSALRKGDDSLIGSNAGITSTNCKKNGNILVGSVKPSDIMDAAEDNGAESEFSMHPLLLQSPQNQSLNFNEASTRAPEFSSVNLFYTNQLFQSTQNVSKTIDHDRHCSRTTEISATIDFHPLLQRDDSLGDATEVSSKVRTFFSSEKELLQNVNSEKISSTEHAHTNEIANKVNLDIGLGSTTARVQEAENGAKSALDDSGSNFDILRLRKSSGCEFLSNEPGLIGEGMPSHAAHADDPPDGISMEKEELSDSDLEMEMDVQFECEEISDSEEEMVQFDYEEMSDSSEEAAVSKISSTENHKCSQMASGVAEVPSGNDCYCRPGEVLNEEPLQSCQTYIISSQKTASASMLLSSCMKMQMSSASIKRKLINGKDCFGGSNDKESNAFGAEKKSFAGARRRRGVPTRKRVPCKARHEAVKFGSSNGKMTVGTK